MQPELKMLLKLFGPDVPDNEVIVARQGLRAGRSRDNSLFLDHREISRNHLRIVWQNDAYFVEDMNSSNGTMLNDDRIVPRQLIKLDVGDTIRFGPFLMRVERFFDEAPQHERDRIMPPAPPERTDETSEDYRNYPPGIPRDRSSWLQYLPAIYQDDEFIARYLLIFESMMSPIVWVIDNFDTYFSPELAPEEWLQWIAGWFDMLLIPELPIERQRALMDQIGWLYLRRGTRTGLERLLELYFGVRPEIVEPPNQACHFIVKIALSKSQNPLPRVALERLIESQKPAFASYALEIS